MNRLKTFLLMSLMTVLFIFLGSLLGGERGIVLAFAFAVIMNFSSYWFSDKIVLRSYKAQQINKQNDPELFNLIENLTYKAALPMPNIYMIPSDSPNAFATGRNPNHAAVAVTYGIRKMLNREELESVLAHELSHIKNRDILIGTIAATFVGALTSIAHFATYALMFSRGGGKDDDNGGIGSLVLLVLAPIAATLIQLAISRSREYMADEGAANLCGKPLALANALQKLEQGIQIRPMEVNPSSAHLFIANPLSSGFVTKLFSTHPPTTERIKKLRMLR
jgi:heat shock protein HtpX